MEISLVDVMNTISLFLMSEDFFILVGLTVGSVVGVWMIVALTRMILQRIFAVPLGLQRRVLHILVPKEAAKKEEEDKSSKKDYKELIAVGEHFFSNLGFIKPKGKLRTFFLGRDDEMALEIVSVKGLIRFYAVVPAHLQSLFEQQLHAQYPSAEIELAQDHNIFRPHGSVKAVPISLSRKSIFSLKTYKKMDSDPLNGLTNALSKVDESQGVTVQIVIRTASKGWQKEGMKVARDMQKGKSLEEALGKGDGINKVFRMFWNAVKSKDSSDEKPKEVHLSPLEQELIKSMEEKSSKGGFETNIRIVSCADREDVAKHNLYNIVGSFAQYTGAESGIGFRKVKWFSMKNLLNNYLYRNFDEKKSFILNSEELASIFHLPSSSTETPNIEWLKARSASPPTDLPKEGIVLGESDYRGRRQKIRLLPEDRQRHVYIIGMTGVGKSTLMVNMMIQDIQAGHGCCYIDPHGQDLEKILENVPPERADDVILFDPSDLERPIGLNMLEGETEQEKDFLSQEMIAIFYKLVSDPSMIGPMFEHYMRNAMLTLMADKDRPNTIVEIPRILTDRDFQDLLLEKVTDPIIRAFWQKELPQTAGNTKGEMLPYLVSKIGRFIENNMVRNIIGQAKSGFDFREVMDKQKILLVNLSKGRVGEINSFLLGLIVVTKLQMAALSRADIAESERKDFFLYVDEFSNFITDSIATILSEARKYKLDLILGHQYVSQLMPRQGDTKVRDAIFGNVGTIACFRVGVDDAEMMAKQMAPVFNEFDVMNIEKRTAYLRLLIQNTAARPFNIRTFASPQGDPRVAAAIRQLSRLKYGRDRLLVESEILERSRLGADEW
jgi:hypothetical protein